MPRKIKVAEVVSRLESGGVKSMLLNYLGHFKHPEDDNVRIPAHFRFCSSLRC